MRVGVVRRDSDGPTPNADVDEAYATAERLKTWGHRREGLHPVAPRRRARLVNGSRIDGALALMVRGNGGGTNAKGYYDYRLIDAFGRGRARTRTTSRRRSSS